MHAMVRTYSGKGAKKFADLLEERKTEVEKVLRSVKGLVSYSMVRTKDGAFSVSVWKDKAAIDEVHKKALEWIRENASATKVSAPTVTEGSVIIQLHDRRREAARTEHARRQEDQPAAQAQPKPK